MWMSDEEYAFVTGKTPIPCVDLVILRNHDNRTEVLLLTRKTGQYSGAWCIIGGRVRLGETIKQAIDRHAADLGVTVAIIKPFEVDFPALLNGNFKDDRTKHYIVSVYPVEITKGVMRREGEEYTGSGWFDVNNLPQKMAYDHKEEILKTINRL